MTTDELWRAVGEALAVQMMRRGWTPIDIEKRGGPNYKTVQAINRGNIGRVDNVERYARVLDLSLVDLLQSILQPDRAVSPEVAQIIRKYDVTTIAGRQALIQTAAALPEETQSTVSEARGVVPRSTTDTPPATIEAPQRKRADRP